MYGGKPYVVRGSSGVSGAGMYGGQTYAEKATKLSISVTAKGGLSAVI